MSNGHARAPTWAYLETPQVKVRSPHGPSVWHHHSRRRGHHSEYFSQEAWQSGQESRHRPEGRRYINLSRRGQKRKAVIDDDEAGPCSDKNARKAKMSKKDSSGEKGAADAI
ncbi:hypothetical protein N7G274_004879 [Stereocaulon virgatum]|uniref:Uncharacterized protein n=1 Tax=Stereocaulon virgatum TaxID=373712 RepID=A0ABR4A919_9LECA